MSTETTRTDDGIDDEQLPDHTIVKHGYSITMGYENRYYYLSPPNSEITVRFDEVTKHSNTFTLKRDGVNVGRVDRDSLIPDEIITELDSIAAET